jgi:transcriptional regulator with XRE-family HTH domain
MASPDPSPSPLGVFGRMLRYYRVKAGMSQSELCALVYCSDDLISKIEMGQRTPTQEFTAACDGVPQLGTGGALTELREQLRDYLRQQVYPGWFHRWPEAEAEARALRWYEPLLVPVWSRPRTTPEPCCGELRSTRPMSRLRNRSVPGCSARKS